MRQELLALREHLVSPPSFLLGFVLLIFLVLCVFCFVCLLPVSCVPSVVSDSLFILDCPFSFLWIVHS